jgi:hypothetical protein
MKTTSKLALTMCILAGSIGPAQAETVEDYIEHNNEIRSLDQSIERYERLVIIAEAQKKLIEINNPKPKKKPADQGLPGDPVRYFSPGPEGEFDDFQSNQPQQQLTEEEQAEADRAAARSKELGLMNDAHIVEVFRSNGEGSSYGAVISADGNARAIEPGDMVSHWKVKKISLDLITLENQKYANATVNLKQIR